ncbi:MAG: DNA repair protein RadC [Clostridium sp.]|uniref:RadC family protein n=1 Tax=Clostridium sp. TaxID=1506 RepID=UPI00305FB2BC
MNKNIKLKDMPIFERPREKLLALGVESLTNSELLAIILKTGAKGENVVSLSNRVLTEFDGLDGILSAGYDDITQIKGIKESKASQILALGELYKRFHTLRSQRQNFKVTCPKDIAELLYNEMGYNNQEVLKLIMLNTKNIVIGKKDIFKGSLNSSIVHPREVFSEALKRNSASIIVCHNHPSGDPSPSKEDINITVRLAECGKIMGIDLLDHIIIGSNKFISLKEKGII